MHVNALLDFDVVAVDIADELNVLLDITAPAADGGDRAAATLQIVLDRSGSMNGGKLQGAVRALLSLVERLDARDNFGLVSFDGQAVVEIPAGPLTDKKAIRELISALRTGGNTNLSSGLLRGIQEACRVSGDRGATLLLISDGHANDGVTDHELLAECARGAYAHGVTITTLGYGLGYDEALLGAIADGGAGNAHHAEEPDTAVKLIAGEVENLLAKTAQAVSLIVSLSDPVQSVTVGGGLTARTLGSGELMIELGDFYAGETRRMLLHLTVPGCPMLGPVGVATIACTYVDPATLTSYTVTLPLIVNSVPGDEAAGRVPNPTVRTELAFQEAQKAKLAASESLRKGDRAGASALFLEARDELQRRLAEAPADMEAEIRREIAALFGFSVNSLSIRDAGRAAKEAYFEGTASSRKRRRMQEIQEQLRAKDEEN